jgi:hypothetical protein
VVLKMRLFGLQDKHRQKQLIRFLGLAVAAMIVVNLLGLGLYLSQPILKTRTFFATQPSPLSHTYDLFDVGVVDANTDRHLDLFTLNHSARQDLRLGQLGTTPTQDVLSAWQLDQDHRFDGIEDSDQVPEIDRPGLYIYRQNFALHLRAYQLPDTVSGELQLFMPVRVQQRKAAEVTITESAISDDVVQTRIAFKIRPEGRLVLQGFPEIPHQFQIQSKIPLEQIFLGMQKVHPANDRFELLWRDRHTMAWADFNQDNQMDVFVGRGGIRGKLQTFPIRLEDELFVGQDNKFLDQWKDRGFRKGDCPVRQSAWVDFNLDNRLDLYIGCGRLVKDPTPYPNRLYQQQANGQFVDVAAQVGLDLPREGHAFWIDIDQDNDPDFITGQGDVVQVYVNKAGQFEQQGADEKFNQEVTKLAVADFDRDEDLDVYVVVKGGQNGLLRNTNGQYRRESPAAIGLPSKGLDANWVDYDNDGLMDLHTVPSGLYQQISPNKFQATQMIDLTFPKFNTWNARSAWFDRDNDGDRDLLLAYQQTPALLQPAPALSERITNQLKKRNTDRIWQSKFYENTGSKNHWLSIDLAGNPGNPQAIGAKVWVTAGDQTQFQPVGSSENSRYSQGHYRLYFGLGQANQVQSVRVLWPNGKQQTMNSIPGNQLITLHQETDMT